LFVTLFILLGWFVSLMEEVPIFPLTLTLSYNSLHIYILDNNKTIEI